MGKRPTARQESPLWVRTADLPTSARHPFFERLNRVLEEAGFDAFVEQLCAVFYAARMGRPRLRPGRYFRLLSIGYFEGLSSERGIARRVADSLSLRSFLDLDVTARSPDQSALSRTRRLINVETHVAVFTWVLERLAEAGLVKGTSVDTQNRQLADGGRDVDEGEGTVVPRPDEQRLGLREAAADSGPGPFGLDRQPDRGCDARRHAQGLLRGPDRRPAAHHRRPRHAEAPAHRGGGLAGRSCAATNGRRRS